MALFTAALTITGCTKVAGPQGPTGPAGTNGKANVTYETATISTWQWNSTINTNYADVVCAIITLAIIDSGAVNVYISTGPDTWAIIPYTLWGSPSYSYSYKYGVGTLEIDVSNTLNTDQSTSLGPLLLKIVVIQ